MVRKDSKEGIGGNERKKVEQELTVTQRKVLRRKRRRHETRARKRKTLLQKLRRQKKRVDMQEARMEALVQAVNFHKEGSREEEKMLVPDRIREKDEEVIGKDHQPGPAALSTEDSQGDGIKPHAAPLFLSPLTKEEEAAVTVALSEEGNNKDVMGQAGGNKVNRESFQTLRHRVWLNDSIIHYVCHMLAKRDRMMSCSDRGHRRSHFFSSFFYTTLHNEGHKDPSVEGKYSYIRVKKWSKKVVGGGDIFVLDKVFFPINVGRMHWICVVAFMQEKRIQIYDSGAHYGGGDECLQAIMRYLQDEHMATKGIELPEPEKWHLRKSDRDTPHQRNGKWFL
jgi:Ulp1 family protease